MYTKKTSWSWNSAIKSWKNVVKNVCKPWWWYLNIKKGKNNNNNMSHRGYFFFHTTDMYFMIKEYKFEGDPRRTGSVFHALIHIKFSGKTPQSIQDLIKALGLFSDSVVVVHIMF